MKILLKELKKIDQSSGDESLKKLKERKAMREFKKRLLTEGRGGLLSEVMAMIRGYKIPESGFQAVLRHLRDEKGIGLEIGAVVFNTAIQKIKKITA